MCSFHRRNGSRGRLNCEKIKGSPKHSFACIERRLTISYSSAVTELLRQKGGCDLPERTP